MGQSNLIGRMREQAEAVQTVVRCVSGWTEVIRYALDLTVRQQGKTLCAAGLAEEVRAELKAVSGGQGLSLLEPPYRNHLESIHTAVTGADWGIAETGTLVIDSTSEDLRIATMLSETHVAVLPAERIRADALDLLAEINAIQHHPPRYLAFISGASRTADIERVLSIGVHGPKELHILILEGNQEEAT